MLEVDTEELLASKIYSLPSLPTRGEYRTASKLANFISLPLQPVEGKS